MDSLHAPRSRTPTLESQKNPRIRPRSRIAHEHDDYPVFSAGHSVSPKQKGNTIATSARPDVHLSKPIKVTTTNPTPATSIVKKDFIQKSAGKRRTSTQRALKRQC